MSDLNVVAVVVAAVTAFLISGAYYALLGERLARLSPAYALPGRSTGATVAVELARNAVAAAGVAALAGGLDLSGLGQAMVLALGLWVAFPAVLLAGSVFHERVPPLLAAIHSGDWLLKLMAVTSIVTVWA